jgi:hypothetical protein
LAGRAVKYNVGDSPKATTSFLFLTVTKTCIGCSRKEALSGGDPDAVADWQCNTIEAIVHSTATAADENSAD